MKLFLNIFEFYKKKIKKEKKRRKKDYRSKNLNLYKIIFETSRTINIQWFYLIIIIIMIITNYEDEVDDIDVDGFNFDPDNLLFAAPLQEGFDDCESFGGVSNFS